MKESKQNSEKLLVYGVHAVKELIQKNSDSIDKIYFTDKEKRGALFELQKEAKRKKCNYANIPTSKLDKMADFHNHQGVVAFRTVRPYNSEEQLWDILKTDKNPLILIPAGIEDPGNLGAIIRSASAFSVSAIVVERKGSVALNGTVAKTSAGMIEHIPIVKPQNMEGLVKELKERGFKCFGADSSGSKTPEQIDFRSPTIIITGGEHAGIPPYLEKLCDDIISIPMKSEVESLNVSVAAGILLYETQRQRMI